MIRTIRLVSIVTAAALTISAVPAEAKTLRMTVVSAAPPIVTYVRVAKTKFIPEVNRRLAASGKDFKIEWIEAYSQSLAKFSEVFETVEEGIAQVGLILKNFEPSKLALEQFNYVVPFVGIDSTQMITIDRNMRKSIPELNEVYGKFDQVFLHSGTSPSMQLRLQAIPSLLSWGVAFLRNSTPSRFVAATADNYRLAIYSRDQTLTLAARLQLDEDTPTPKSTTEISTTTGSDGADTSLTDEDGEVAEAPRAKRRSTRAYPLLLQRGSRSIRQGTCT